MNNRIILPLNPQAVHGIELVTDCCQEQLIERPAAEHLARIIRSAVYQFETKLQNILFTRLSLDSKVAINHLLSAEEPITARINEVTFSDLKADPGRPSLENVLSVIAQLKCLNGVAIQPNIFQGICKDNSGYVYQLSGGTNNATYNIAVTNGTIVEPDTYTVLVTAYGYSA